MNEKEDFELKQNTDNVFTEADANFVREAVNKAKEEERSHRNRTDEFRQMMKGAEKKRRKNRVLNILLVVFAAVFLVSGFFLVRYYIASHNNRKLVDSLKEMLDTEEPGENPAEKENPETPSSKDKSSEKEEKSTPESPFVNVGGKLVLRKFGKLYEKNPDFVGWLSIEDTSVDYPVMYTPYDEEKYLRKNYDGEYALAGTLFLAADSDPVRPATNLIIYGHNMKDGSMFSDILKYKKQDFYEEHKLIRFDTIYGTNTYEVLAAFPGQILEMGAEGFRYYTFFNAETAEDFNDYIENVTALSVISTTAEAAFGDELLTLSTCENVGANEGKRFVVVAKRIGE
ncbi:MAG: class B sortase [Eubacterium sp.]|nr:class B sortase [Eubacterium sp.]